MSKSGEKLSILSEHGQLLLQRMYLVKKELETPEKLDLIKGSKIAGYMKDTLEFPDNLETNKKTEYGDFKSKQQQILKVTTPIFCTFREYVEWSETALKTLEEISVTTGVELAFETNMCFMSDYLDTLSTYAKLALLSEKIPDKKLAIGLYNLAYFKSNGRSEPFISKIATFFKSFIPTGLLNFDSGQTAVLKVLRSTLYKIQHTVGKCLISAVITYEKGTMEYLSFKRPLELLSDPEKIPYPASEDAYFELTYHQQIIDWVTFGYLCCPEGLGASLSESLKQRYKANKGILFLYQILSQSFVVPLYADEMVPIHELYADLFGRFKGQSINLKNERKTLQTQTDNSTTLGPRLHGKRRMYLRIQLRALYRMLLDFPALISPKFQLVLGCLHLAKTEIIWYFNHYGQKPKNVKTYKEVFEPFIGELIYLMDEVSSICLGNKQAISDYHLEFLRKVYLKKLTGIIDQVKDKFEGSVKQLLLSFLEDLEKSNNFVSLRMNVKRLQILLSGYSYKAIIKETVFAQLLSTLNTVYHLSRHVDEVEQQVYQHGILKELYYFEPIVVKLYNSGLTSRDNSPLFSHSYIRLINYFQHVAHKSLPDYRASIGNLNIQTGLKMLNTLILMIEQGINDLKGQSGFEYLANQIGGDKAGYRIKCKVERVKEPPFPGEESMFDDDYMEKMRVIESNLTKLLFSLNTYPEITIYDTIFYPSEFLREKLEIFIQKHILETSQLVPEATEPDLKKLRAKDTKPLKFLPPSVLEEKLAVFMFSLKVVEQCVNINIEELVLSAFLENFVHLNYVENAYSFTTTGEPENTIITYAKWYVDMIVDAPTKLKFLYHPLRKCFSSTKESTVLSYKIQEYCDFQEMMALSRLVGPYGVRVVDQLFLGKIHSILDLIKEQISTLRSTVKEIGANIYQDKLYDTYKGKFKTIDKLFELLIILGGLITFRSHLREGLEISIQNTIPPVHDLINDVLNQYPKNTFKDEKFFPIDGLALDVGINQSGVDNGFKKIITQTEIADVLSHTLACLIFSPSWSSVDYNVHMEGWTNNSHLACYAINHLMMGIFGKDKQTLTLEYSKFAELSAALLLNVKNDKLQENCFIFTDKIVRGTEFYEQSFWEEYCPYNLIRWMYSNAYTRGIKELSKK